MRPRAPGSIPRALAGLALAVLVAGLAELAPDRVAGPAPALAQDGEEVDEDATRNQLERIRKKQEETQRKIDELKQKESGSVKDLRRTDAEIRRTTAQLRRLERRERQLERDLGVVRNDLEEATSTLERRRRLLADRLRALYKWGRFRELEMLLGADSFAQLFKRAYYLEKTTQQEQTLLASIREEKQRITLTREELDATLRKVESNAKTKVRQKSKLSGERKKKERIVSSIQNERKAYEAAAEDLRRTARQLEQLLARLEAQRRGDDWLGPYEGQFSVGKGQLPWPVRGELAGRFGTEKHPKWGTETVNSGIDIRAPLGTDVRAVARARVDHVSTDFGSYGQLVILNHGEGYYTLYAHLSAILVSRGQEVESGTVIGRVGDTGSLKGSILHFEVRKGRQALNPLGWLR